MREEYLGGPRTDHFIRRYPEGGEACDDEGEASTVGLSYQQRADVCTTRGHATPTFPEASEASRRGGLLLAEGLVREWVRAVGVVAASGTLVTLVVLGFGVSPAFTLTLAFVFLLSPACTSTPHTRLPSRSCLPSPPNPCHTTTPAVTPAYP